MGRPAALKHRDRVRRLSTGAPGTLVDVHNEGSALGVLPDDGPKRLQTWPRVDVERTAGPARTCSRCPDEDHRTFDCPPGDR